MTLMKKACITTLLLLVGICVLLNLWDIYASRPSALYEQWLGGPVPTDVTQLDGRSQFALTESTQWLSFHTTQSRIDTIRSQLGMSPVVALKGWSGPNVVQEVQIDGRTYHNSWFGDGMHPFTAHLTDLQVYWKAHGSGDPLSRGYALYYSPSLGLAHYILISI